MGIKMINYNMRCIEILKNVQKQIREGKINYNMRCIEIEKVAKGNKNVLDKLQHEMY